jgi:cardiolipin synthase
MAVADKWVGDADSDEHWRDTMVMVTGPPAQSLQTAFAAEWAFTTGEILSGSAFFPPMADQPGAGSTEPAPVPPNGSGAPGAPIPPLLLHIGLAAAPSSSEDHPMWLFFMRTFSAARRRLWIETPYFVADKALREVVEGRARAGVEVRLLLPDQHTDAKMIRLTSHHYYQELLDAGVHVHEYKATMNHSKHVVVDDAWSVVGSANMDVRSLELNHENVLGVQDRAFAASVEQAFVTDLAKAHEIKTPEWSQRGWFTRVKENVAVVLSEQY